MENLGDIYFQTIPLAYDMRVVFRPSRLKQPGTVMALFLLRLADSTDEEAGFCHVSTEFLRVVAPDVVAAHFQRTADSLIAQLSQ